MLAKLFRAPFSSTIPIPSSDRSSGVPGGHYVLVVKREKLSAWWPGGVPGYLKEFAPTSDDGAIVSVCEMGSDGRVTGAAHRFDQLGFIEGRDYFFCNVFWETLLLSRPRTPPWLFSWLIDGGYYFFRLNDGVFVAEPESSGYWKKFKA